MTTCDLFLQGLLTCVQPENLLALAAGIISGILSGILPGFTTLGMIALLLPLCASLGSTAALILLTAICYSSKYSCSITAVLMNFPSDTAAVAASHDGYALTRQGRGGAALMVVTGASCLAGLAGTLALLLLAPPLAALAVHLGPPEYFAIALVSLCLLTWLLGSTTPLKAVLMTTSGLMLSTLGTDELSGLSRPSAAIPCFDPGLNLPLLTLGLFCIGEFIQILLSPPLTLPLPALSLRMFVPSLFELKEAWKPALRGSITGFVIGLLPGPAPTTASMAAYALERHCDKAAPPLGQGAWSGIAAPEAANSAAIAGLLLPLLTIGLPLTGGTALLLSLLSVHHILAGPALIGNHPQLFWTLMASMFIGNLLLLLVNLPLSLLLCRLLRQPGNVLITLAAAIALTCAYIGTQSLADLTLVFVAGILGFGLRHSGFPLIPLILGLVLGPTLEYSFIQSMLMTAGSWQSLLTRPLFSCIILAGLLLLLCSIRACRRSASVKT